jgi:5-methylcytosine-specific restriction endonuclease McrA
VWRPLFSRNEVRRKLMLRVGTTSRASWYRVRNFFGFRCAYCGISGQPLQKDHVVPLSRGGLDIPQNVVPACHDCNLSKGDKALRYWMVSCGYHYELFILQWLRYRRTL